MTQITDESLIADAKWLKLFSRKFERNGKAGEWFFCARENPPLAHKDKNPNAVVICATHHDDDGVARLVVISEFRVPIMAREWGFPAGLIEDGEDPKQSAIREFKEETGLDLEVVGQSPPNLYSTAGMTNESTTVVFGHATGKPSNQHNEVMEDITIYLMDKEDLDNFMTECQEGTHAVSDKAWCLMRMHQLTLGDGGNVRV